MYTIKEYLKYYKDLTFEECPININDVILFAELSYIDWNNIVSKGPQKVTLKEAGMKYLDSNNKYLSNFMKSNISNLKDMLTGKRYQNIYLSNFREYVDTEKQFGALCIHFTKEKVFISFEGTNGTVIGWKEDFTLGYHFPVISQKYAINYLNEVITNKDKEIYVGGHSKGGNLAMTAAMYTKEDIFTRIKYIYNLDGPGFKENQLHTKELKRILPKLEMYVPEDSVVGMLLYSTKNYNVVKSNTNGIMQHDCNTWLCFGTFLEEGKQSKLSIKINNKIKEWNKKYSDEELEEMITTFFKILENNNIKSFKELKKLKWNQVVNLINEVSDIDDNTKKLYYEALKELILIKESR